MKSLLDGENGMRHMIIAGVILSGIGAGFIFFAFADGHRAAQGTGNGDVATHQTWASTEPELSGSDGGSTSPPSVSGRGASFQLAESKPQVQDDDKMPSEEDADPVAPKIADAKRRLRGALDNAQRGQKLTEDLSLAVKALAEAGGSELAAAVLGKEYQNSVLRRLFGRARVVILALKDLGTLDAKKTLGDIAMRSAGGPLLGGGVVRAYAAMGASAAELIQLMDSDDPVVRDEALCRIGGLPLSKDEVDRLGKELDSKSWLVRQGVAAAFGLDTQVGAEDKIDLVMASCKTLNDLENADKVIPESRLGFTDKEMALQCYLRSLTLMKGAENTLRRYLASNDSTERSLAALALAGRGDEAARDEVIRIIGESDDGYLRMLAVPKLAKIGKESDKAMLQNLAESDPYKRPSFREGKEVEWFPVRDAAKYVLRTME